MKKIYFLLLTILSSLFTTAQEKLSLGIKQLEEHLQKTSYEIDPSAKAVILFEQATAIMRRGEMRYEYQIAIKILNSDVAGNLAEVSILKPMNCSVRKIKGTTYNFENGQVSKQTVEKADRITDKITPTADVIKFNLPSVKNGSIIHYSYVTEKPFFIEMPTWKFQSKFPTLVSAYEIEAANYLVYVPIERVHVPIKYVNQIDSLYSSDACSIRGEYSPGRNFQIWVRQNIPAYAEEPFMPNIENMVERVKFQVTGISDEGLNIKAYNNWKDYSQKYYYEDNEVCGQVFSSNNFLSKTVNELILEAKSDIDKAKTIYSYVRNNYTAKESMAGSIASNNIKEVYSKKEGSKFGINLLLTAMLCKAGLTSDVVLLATKSNEKLNAVFPEPRLINYLICRVKIDKETYLLDASEKNLSFAVLSPDCYNGYCRIVNKFGGELELTSNMINNKSIVLAKMEPIDGTKKMKLRVEVKFGTFTSIEKREEWLKDSSEIQKMILKETQLLSFPSKLKKYQVKNLLQPELPLMLTYEMDLESEFTADNIYLQPYFAKFLDKNPFVIEKRKYDIEFDYKQDIVYNFRFVVPDDYEIDEYPKSTHLSLSENDPMEMKNIIVYDTASRVLSVSSRFTTKETSFAVGKYDNIRSFYDAVIEEQNKKVVLKKKM